MSDPAELGRCVCGDPKSIKKVLCENCYVALPVGMRFKLYSCVPQERADAMEDAIELLERKGRVKA